jgi:hypothetical protein
MTRAKMSDNADGKQSTAKPAAKPAAKKLHLKEIRSVQAADGSIVHHHTYADHKDAKFPHPERGPMATSTSADEAGQHVAEQFGMNGMAQGEEGAGEGAGAGQQQQQAAPPAAAPPEE